eukprot:12793387-Alexandrium_andersonii.AAC.1
MASPLNGGSFRARSQTASQPTRHDARRCFRTGGFAAPLSNTRSRHARDFSPAFFFLAPVGP